MLLCKPTSTTGRLSKIRTKGSSTIANDVYTRIDQYTRTSFHVAPYSTHSLSEGTRIPIFWATILLEEMKFFVDSIRVSSRSKTMLKEKRRKKKGTREPRATMSAPDFLQRRTYRCGRSC